MNGGMGTLDVIQLAMYAFGAWAIYVYLRWIWRLPKWTEARPDRCSHCKFPLVYTLSPRPTRCSECGRELVWDGSGRNVIRKRGRLPIWLAAAAAIGLVAIVSLLLPFSWLREPIRRLHGPSTDWAIVHVEDVRAGGLDRLVVASPPGTTEADVRSGLRVADIQGGVEFRIHREDGAVFSYNVDRGVLGEELVEWLEAAGVEPPTGPPDVFDISRAPFEAGDPPWATRIASQVYRIRTRDIAYKEYGLGDRILTRHGAVIPLAAEGERGIRILTPAGSVERTRFEVRATRAMAIVTWAIGSVALIAAIVRYRRAVDREKPVALP